MAERRRVKRDFVIACAERSNAETGVSTPPRSCLRQRDVDRGAAEAAPVRGRPASRATSSAGEGLRAPAAAVLDASEPNDQGRRRSFSRIIGQPALEALKAFMLLTEAPAASTTRCPPNLNSHNHNQHAGRPCFSLAVLIEHLSSTPRYDISLRRNRASNIRGPAVPPRVDRWPMPRLVTAEPSCARCRECAWSAMRTTIGRH
jgi:hypothetical protein